MATLWVQSFGFAPHRSGGVSLCAAHTRQPKLPRTVGAGRWNVCVCVCVCVRARVVCVLCVCVCGSGVFMRVIG